jgi:threonine synthase
MDILISSNVERLIYDKFGPKRCKELMDDLKEKGAYELTKDELVELQKDFRGYHCNDNETKHYISEYSSVKNYLMDPHTATCIKAYDDIKCSRRKTVICSTAEWTKFAPAVMNAISCQNKTKFKDLEALEGVSKIMGVDIHPSIKKLFNSKIIHDTVIDKEDLEKEIFKFLEE